MYGRVVKLIERPRNVEQFTLTEEHFGEIKWQSLKIVAYRLKYRVEEQQDRYACFRIKEQPEGGLPFEDLSPVDQAILYAFEALRKSEREYSDQYSE